MFRIALPLIIVLIIFILTFDDSNGQTKKRPNNHVPLKDIHKYRNKGQNRGKNGKNKNTGKGKRNNNNNTKPLSSNFLYVQNGKLMYKKQQIFLSGANIAYKNYATDFGKGAYSSVKSQYETWLSQIAAAGGNTARIYLHGDGRRTPMLDSQGFATGEETASLIQELGQFLDAAQKNNLLIIIGLWNAGDRLPLPILNFFSDAKKLDRYLDKVLKPLVSALKTKKSLAIWDVVNEPEGSVLKDIFDENPCFNTQNLVYKGGDWSMNNITMKDMLRFANHHAAAIKSVDPKALKYIASREEESSNYCSLCRDYWTDKCLIGAGGKPMGTVDLYHMETFTWMNKYYYWSPMKKIASDYKLSKPIIVGSISSACSESNSSANNFVYLYNSGYSGALNWQYSSQGYCFDTAAKCDDGIRAIKDSTANGVIKITVS